jgi:hypothetical protein
MENFIVSIPYFVPQYAALQDRNMDFPAIFDTLLISWENYQELSKNLTNSASRLQLRQYRLDLLNRNIARLVGSEDTISSVDLSKSIDSILQPTFNSEIVTNENISSNLGQPVVPLSNGLTPRQESEDDSDLNELTTRMAALNVGYKSTGQFITESEIVQLCRLDKCQKFVYKLARVVGLDKLMYNRYSVEQLTNIIVNQRLKKWIPTYQFFDIEYKNWPLVGYFTTPSLSKAERMTAWLVKSA